MHEGRTCRRSEAVRLPCKAGDQCSVSAVQHTWSLDASMPMLSAMARTTVGPAPVKRPPTPSSRTIL